MTKPQPVPPGWVLDLIRRVDLNRTLANCGRPLTLADEAETQLLIAIFDGYRAALPRQRRAEARQHAAA